MAWTIRYSAAARDALARLERSDQLRIIHYLRSVAALDDPSLRGKALAGNLAGYWRYRIGDFRVVCLIEHRKAVILAVKIEHRSSAYR